MTLLNPTDTSPNLEQPGRFLRANMTVNHDPESIVNEPGHGFLGHLASCIQRYPYRGRQQFLVDFEAERHRYRTNTSGHVSEWFLLTGVDNLIFRSEFIEPVDQNTPWTSWDSYDAHLQLLLDQVTCSRDRLHNFSQYISGRRRAQRAKALPQGYPWCYTLRVPGCQRARSSLATTSTSFQPLARLAQRRGGGRIF